MRFSSLALAACAAVGVMASKRAGGWEAVMFYEMYRLDFDANGAKGLTIGKDCKPAPCNFPQFIDHIQKKTITIKENGVRVKVGKFDPAKAKDHITDLVDPDPKDASGLMSWEGRANPKPGAAPFSYDAVYDKSALLGSAASGTSNHGDVLQKLASITKANKGKGGADSKIISRVEDCATNILKARMQDNFDGFIKDFQKMVLDPINKKISDDKKHLKAELSPQKDSASGVEYDMFDSNKMTTDIQNAPLNQADKTHVLNKMAEYATDYTVKDSLSSNPNSGGVTHWRDVTAAQSVLSDVQSPAGGSCST